MRFGFTLIESLIALVIFEFALLALVATSAMVARDLAAFKRRTLAHTIAVQRVELLRPIACNSPPAGVIDSAGFVERWTVATQGLRRSISDSVVFSLPRGRRANVVIRATTLCARS